MSQEQMQSVPIEEILCYEAVPVEIYVSISPEKYLLVAKVGTETSHLKKYQERNLNAVYVRIHDYLHLVQLSLSKATSSVSSPTSSVLEKITGLRDAMSSVYREIGDLGFDDAVFSHVKLVNHTTLTLLAKTPRVVDMLVNLEELEEGEVKHALMVSLISAMLGISHGWTKPGTIEKLSLAGFLHDVGKTKLPRDIIMKKPAELSPDERVIYRSHPEVSAQLLLQSRQMPEDVILAVQEHHELADGSGYPRGIKDLVTSPLARVVSLASAFVEEVEARSGTQAAVKAREIVDLFLHTHNRKFNRDALQALKKLFPGEKGQASA